MFPRLANDSQFKEHPVSRRAFLALTALALPSVSVLADVPAFPALNLDATLKLRLNTALASASDLNQAPQFTPRDFVFSFVHTSDPIGGLPHATRQQYLTRLCRILSFYSSHLPEGERIGKFDVSWIITFGSNDRPTEAAVRDMRPWIGSYDNPEASKKLEVLAWRGLEHEVSWRPSQKGNSVIFTIPEITLGDLPLVSSGTLVPLASNDGWPIQNQMLLLSVVSKMNGLRRAQIILSNEARKKGYQGRPPQLLLSLAAAKHSHQVLDHIQRKTSDSLRPIERAWLKIVIAEREAELRFFNAKWLEVSGESN